MSRKQGSGLTDKLYWRKRTATSFAWCCYTKDSSRKGYISLCGRWDRKKSGGQGSGRPPSIMRCGRCDGLEAARRGWEDECGEEAKNWRDYA